MSLSSGQTNWFYDNELTLYFSFQEDLQLSFPLAISIALLVVTLVILAAAQVPAFQHSPSASGGAAVTVIVLFTAGTLILSGPAVPLPLFALVVTSHTVLPVPRPVSVSLAVLMSITHLVLSAVRSRHSLSDSMFYSQVTYLSDFLGGINSKVFLITLF